MPREMRYQIHLHIPCNTSLLDQAPVMAQAEAAAPATHRGSISCNAGRQGRDGEDVCEGREGFGEITAVIVPRYCSHRV